MVAKLLPIKILPMGLSAALEPLRNYVNTTSAFLGTFRPTARTGFLEFSLKLDCDAEAARSYEYSKLYYSVSPQEGYSEQDVICFRVRFRHQYERIRLVLPGRARQNGYVRLRLDALPYSAGRFQVKNVRLVPADLDDEASRRARFAAQKEWVRQQVVRSEQQLRVTVPHYPESLSIELTPRCNLTCTHCSSHGTAALHHLHNCKSAFSPAMLARLAHEVFPHLTVVNLVGRGEPLMVSDELWAQLVALLERYGVLLSCVTNGYFIRRRIDERVLPLIDTLTVSIDGLDPETFAINRGGASLERVLENAGYFHVLRERIPLARRPKLCFSWTLKKNNVAQFPDFIRFIKQFDPDLLYVRHLLVFHEKDKEQSLLDSPVLANTYLREGYALLADSGIKHDCPPLMIEGTEPGEPREQCQARPESGRPSSQTIEDTCLYIHRTGVILAGGEVPTCGNMYATGVGSLDEHVSFWDLWNGSMMQSVRESFGTTQEWQQCRSCWFRETKYHLQRRARASRQEDDSLLRGTRFSPEAWDFRGYGGS